MKLAVVAFFVLLAHAHQACGLDRPLEQTLCSFRGGPHGWLGYALFCTLALIGLLYALTLKKYGRSNDAVSTASFGVLFVMIAATPQGWAIHRASAMVLLASLYTYFAILLSQSSRKWLLVHLCVPIVLALVTGFQSYGFWQKLLISYFVIAALIHHHLVKRGAKPRSEVRPEWLRESNQPPEKLSLLTSGLAAMKNRKLRIAWSVCWGVPCLLLFLLWGRSYLYSDQATMQWPMANHLLGAISERGSLAIGESESDQEAQPEPRWALRSHPRRAVGLETNAVGFRYHRFGAGNWFLTLPYWLLALPAAVAVASPWVRWRFSLGTLQMAVALVAVGLGCIVVAAVR